MSWLDWVAEDWEEWVTEDDRAATLAGLESLRQRNGETYAYLLEVIARSDPIGIGYLSPDEYVPEVDRVFARLRTVSDPDSLQVLMHEVFVEMFSARSAGPMERYEQAARDFWKWWQAR